MRKIQNLCTTFVLQIVFLSLTEKQKTALKLRKQNIKERREKLKDYKSGFDGRIEKLKEKKQNVKQRVKKMKPKTKQ